MTAAATTMTMIIAIAAACTGLTDGMIRSMPAAITCMAPPTGVRPGMADGMTHGIMTHGCIPIMDGAIRTTHHIIGAAGAIRITGVARLWHTAVGIRVRSAIMTGRIMQEA